MIINGKHITLADCMVKARIPDPKPKKANNTNTAEYIWVAYDDSRARLPVAIAPSAQSLAKIMGVSQNTVYSVWSRFLRGVLSTAKYAKVYIGDNEYEQSENRSCIPDGKAADENL